MSCGSNTSNNGCGDISPSATPQGVKISQLDTMYQLSANDLFVAVDVEADGPGTADQTKNVDYITVIHYDNSDSTLSATNFQDAITEIDSQLGASSGLGGGNQGQVLTKATNQDYDYIWKYPSAGGEGVFEFSDDTTATDPGAGVWKTDNSDTSLATKLYISTVNSLGQSLYVLFKYAKPGSKFIVQGVGDPTIFYVFDLLGQTIDNGTWFEMPMDAKFSGVQILDGQDTAYSEFYAGDLNLEQVLTRGNDAGDFRIENLGIPISGSHAVNVDYLEASLLDYTTSAEFETHVDDYDIHYPMSAINAPRFGGELPPYYATSAQVDDKEDYLGTQTVDGQVLASSGSDVRYWKTDSANVVPDNFIFVSTETEFTDALALTGVGVKNIWVTDAINVNSTSITIDGDNDIYGETVIFFTGGASTISGIGTLHFYNNLVQISKDLTISITFIYVRTLLITTNPTITGNINYEFIEGTYTGTLTQEYWDNTNRSGSGIDDVVDGDTYLRTSGSWVQSDAFDNVNYTTSAEFDVHVYDTSIHYPMSAIDGLVVSGGTTGQVLSKTTSADYDYQWTTNAATDKGELVTVSEGGNTGWIIRDVGRTNKGDIGTSAIDFSFANEAGEHGATGTLSFAEGQNTIANGAVSHAEGQNTQALGISSHSQGIFTSAVGDLSHAGGQSSLAEGSTSFAHGLQAKATGDYSVSMGWETVAPNNSMVALGKFNTASASSLFEIGNGTGAERANAFEITNTGYMYAPQMTIAGISADTNGKVLATKEWVIDDAIWKLEYNGAPLSYGETEAVAFCKTERLQGGGSFYRSQGVYKVTLTTSGTNTEDIVFILSVDRGLVNTVYNTISDLTYNNFGGAYGVYDRVGSMPFDDVGLSYKWISFLNVSSSLLSDITNVKVESQATSYTELLTGSETKEDNIVWYDNTYKNVDTGWTYYPTSGYTYNGGDKAVIMNSTAFCGTLSQVQTSLDAGVHDIYFTDVITVSIPSIIDVGDSDVEFYGDPIVFSNGTMVFNGTGSMSFYNDVVIDSIGNTSQNNLPSDQLRFRNVRSNSTSSSWTIGGNNVLIERLRDVIVVGSYTQQFWDNTADNEIAMWNANKLQGYDVSAVEPQDSDVLVYNTSANVWVPTQLGSDIFITRTSEYDGALQQWQESNFGFFLDKTSNNNPLPTPTTGRSALRAYRMMMRENKTGATTQDITISWMCHNNTVDGSLTSEIIAQGGLPDLSTWKELYTNTITLPINNGAVYLYESVTDIVPDPIPKISDLDVTWSDTDEVITVSVVDGIGTWTGTNADLPRDCIMYSIFEIL